MISTRRISVLVVPDTNPKTNTVHLLVDRKTVILSLSGIPEEQLSQIVQAVYTRQEIQMEAKTD